MSNLYLLKDSGPNLFLGCLTSCLEEMNIYKTVRISTKEEISTFFTREKKGLVIVLIADERVDSLEYLRQLRKNSDIPVLVIVNPFYSTAKIIKELLLVRHISVVSTSCSVMELNSYISDTLAGDKEWVISADIKDKLLIDILGVQEIGVGSFNNREIQILQYTRRGFSIQQIAEEMDLSANTVAAYRSKMLKRSGKRSMVQLLADTVIV